MHFKDKIIKGKKYKYVAESMRLPYGKVKTIEKFYKNESVKELKDFFNIKKKEEFVKDAIKNFGIDIIFDENHIRKIESIKVDYQNLIKNIPKNNLKDLIDRFTANFTYESNALEGNSLTLKDVAIVMFENISIKGKDLREIYETRNSREVVEKIIKNKFKICEKDIITMHKMLVKDTGIFEGYKKFPNVIVGKRVKTTLPEKVEADMQKLIKWYLENKGKMHPLKLAGIFHGKFEQIHPFEDGNGRVGRFLINVILVNNKYPPLIIRKSQRIAYLTALEKFDQKHEETLIRFILRKFQETYKNFFEEFVKYV